MRWKTGTHYRAFGTIDMALVTEMRTLSTGITDDRYISRKSHDHFYKYCTHQLPSLPNEQEVIQLTTAVDSPRTAVRELTAAIVSSRTFCLLDDGTKQQFQPEKRLCKYNVQHTLKKNEH